MIWLIPIVAAVIPGVRLFLWQNSDHEPILGSATQYSKYSIKAGTGSLFQSRNSNSFPFSLQLQFPVRLISLVSLARVPNLHGTHTCEEQPVYSLEVLIWNINFGHPDTDTVLPTRFLFLVFKKAQIV